MDCSQAKCFVDFYFVVEDDLNLCNSMFCTCLMKCL
jgi:hypothetical protein